MQGENAVKINGVWKEFLKFWYHSYKEHKKEIKKWAEKWTDDKQVIHRNGDTPDEM